MEMRPTLVADFILAIKEVIRVCGGDEPELLEMLAELEEYQMTLSDETKGLLQPI